jgi:hypothetical protein
LALEEIVLDRLGSRWRRAARLLEAPAGPTPRTLPMAQDAGQRGIPTAMPRSVAVASTLAASRVPRGVRPARRLARLLLLVVALAVVVSALAMAAGGGSRSSGDRPGADGARSAPTLVPTATPRSTSRDAPNGVGDSQSDDPSDDEEDGPEP